MANSAIGGSTNAPIHINAIARHIGVKLDDRGLGEGRLDIPLLVNMQPAGNISARSISARAGCRR
jgi:dihydroxy-acid dehydratase